MSKILRIDTAGKTHKFEEMGEYAGLGGRALTSKIVFREVPPTCHPLSAANKLAIATGILTGTPAANSGRISLGAKSPLTGTIKESNSGGMFSQKMAKLGIMGIVLENKPDSQAGFVNIIITKDKIEIVPADDIAGLKTYAACEKLHEKYGRKIGIMLIGPAGETQRTAASVQFTDPHGNPARAAGRGGLGAVMGSKKVKAIVVDDSGAEGVPIADKEAFKKASKRWTEILMSHPVTSQGLPGFGTAILINVINEAGALPTKNFREGRFEFAGRISGEAIVENIKARGGKPKEGCHPGCIIQCSQSYNDKDGKYLTSGFEYETVWAFGANTLINDLDDIAMLDRLCDELGVDTIEMGNTIAVAMDGNVIPWGDGKAAIQLLESVGNPLDPMGRIIGNGTAYTGAAFGVDRIPTVKNQALPAYDPRAAKGIGITYATSTMGADHTAGYAICQNVLKVGGAVDPLSKEGQIEISKNLQVATAAVDSSGLCLFVAFAVLDTPDALQTVADMITAKAGSTCTVDDIINLGVAVLKDEIEFNTKAGFTKEHDQLPDFFKEKLPPHNTSWDFSTEEMQAAKV